MAVKVFIMVLCFAIMATIVALVPSLRCDWVVYLLAFATVPGTVLFPFWFFHGMEQMKYISGVNITARILSAIALVAFVREGDYILATAIQSSSLLIIGCVGFKYAWKVAPLKLKLPLKEHIMETIHEGKHLFFSTMASSLCSTGNIFILGMLTDHTVVGYYSAADKILTAVRGLLYPISQSVYPRINVLVSESLDRAIALIR
jgi:PST family polysaccharide transporter